jgi:hypothetical protein
MSKYIIYALQGRRLKRPLHHIAFKYKPEAGEIAWGKNNLLCLTHISQCFKNYRGFYT